MVQPIPDYDVDSAPVAAFTVKRELVAWLRRNERGLLLADHQVVSLPDGGYGRAPELWGIEELLASED